MSNITQFPKSAQVSPFLAEPDSDALRIRRFAVAVQDAIADGFAQGFERGLVAGKKVARAYVIQAVMATSVVWLAIFGIAMVAL